MYIPKLYAPVKIKFWSLRDKLGANMGVINDVDVQVVRTCRRVICENGWKWQIVNYERDREWDWWMEQDKLMLDEFESELEFEFA